jgi:serine/threonine protein kinase/tetratricopeptide (TPR) repeat protein
MLAALREDQCDRWRRGERVPVEAYLNAWPSLDQRGEDVLVLICGEWLLRLESGEQPALSVFQQRFPRYAEELAVQLELLQMLHSTQPALGGEGESTELRRGAHPAPRPTIPGYEVLGLLGRGGMGVVYKARHIPLKRVVALKMLPAGSQADADLQARFRAEAEVVARLQHPNIVQVHDVGEHEGQVYLTMEYVEGSTLAGKLAGTPLPPRAAAELAETLARAVHYAHQRGVIHRDLKPSNILLRRKSEIRNPKSETNPKPEIPKTETPGVPGLGLKNSDVEFVSDFEFRISDFDPKVADFGLAKRWGEAEMSAAGYETVTGAILGTPSYMAPEQAEGRAREVGPAADVWALGAILYELLTGRPPFKGASPLETMEQVRSQEPVPPGRLQPRLPRDLETIGLKCLHKEPSRRYASAQELADDLRRFLAGEPIQARPVGTAERLGRWCRRKPAVAGLVAALALVVVSALAGLTGLWLRAEHFWLRAEDARAFAERKQAEAVADFQLARESVDQYATRVSQNLKLRQEDLRPLRKELLESVAPFYEKLLARHADDPDVHTERARAYLRLAKITEEIADKSQAVALYEKGVALLEQLHQADPDNRFHRGHLAEARTELVTLYTQSGRMAEALAESTKLLALHEALAGVHPDDAALQDDLANNHKALGILHYESGQLALSETHLRKAIVILEALTRRHPEMLDSALLLAECRSVLGVLYRKARQRPQAEAETRAAVRFLEALVGQHPGAVRPQCELAVALNHLALVEADSGREAEAEAALRRAVDLFEGVVRQHPSVTDYQRELALMLNNLANVYRDSGQVSEAETTYRRAVQFFEKLVEHNPTVLAHKLYLASARAGLGRLCQQTGRLAEAAEEFRKALPVQRDLVQQNPTLPRYRNELAKAHEKLASVYLQTGRADLAEAEFRQSVAILQSLAEQHPAVAEYQTSLCQHRLNLGTLYFQSGRLAEALAEYQRALPVAEELARRDADAPTDALVRGMLYSSLGTVFRYQGELRPSLEWFGRAVSTLDPLLHRGPDVAQARQTLRETFDSRARSLNRLNRPEEALKDCDRALQLDTGQRGVALRALHAYTRARLGELAGALVEADELTRTPLTHGGALFELASIHALAAAAVVTDTQLAPAERTVQAERHAARAVELLGKASASGFFKKAARVEFLRKDDDWQALRSRADFQALLSELERSRLPQPPEPGRGTPGSPEGRR